MENEVGKPSITRLGVSMTSAQDGAPPENKKPAIKIMITIGAAILLTVIVALVFNYGGKWMEKYQAAQKLNKEKATTEKLLENSGIVVQVANPDGTVGYQTLSQAFDRLFRENAAIYSQLKAITPAPAITSAE
jgi:flagellar basal body-associated protein FliL